ncbi:MAG: serine hydrolase domain-containing protein [Pseudomonadota bacterium]
MENHLTKLLLFVCLLMGTIEPVHARTEFDRKEIETWADEYFETALSNKKINGASVGLIQDNDVLFLKAYGWQDQQKQIPLDPEQSRFRMCSTSKTMTATALMQLVERGLIASLDDPVNKYLKRYQLPPPYGDDVTFRQLMTHSSGMAGHNTPQATNKEIRVPVDAESIKRVFLENIERKPGTVGIYANLGVAVEGLAIEDITNQTFAAYIDENIFEPLGMDTALMHHSLEKPPNLAQPYAIYPDGSLQDVKFFPKHPLTAPSGGLITSTRDMLKYVALHADEDAKTYPDVLSANGRRSLHARHSGHHASDPGMGLHFYRNTFGNELMVSHGCGLPGTVSLMGILPESKAGFVVTILRGDLSPTIGDTIAKVFGKGRLIKNDKGPKGESANLYALPKAILGEEVLPKVDADESVAGMANNDRDLPGTYWTERRSLRSYSTIMETSTTDVKLGDKEGELIIDGKTFFKRAPGVYDAKQNSNERFYEQSRAIFRQLQPNGEIFLYQHVSFAKRKSNGLKNPKLANAGLYISFGVTLSALLALAWGQYQNLESRIKWLSLGLGICVVILPILIFFGYERQDGILEVDYYNGNTTRVVTAVLLMNVYFLLGLAVVASSIVAWARGLYGGGKRAVLIKMHLSLLALGAIAAWPAMFLFNLIGLQH